MENVMSKGFSGGFKMFKKKKDRNLSLDISDLKEHTEEMYKRIDKMKKFLTLNGEDKWFLCLTKRKETCDEPADT